MKYRLLTPLLLLVLFLSLSYSTTTAHAKLAPGTYTIKDILAHDTNDHPRTLEELKMYLASGNKVPGRTGWSAYELTCTAREDGKNYWLKTDTVTTDDSGRDKHYGVEEYRSEIISAYGTEIYEAALQSQKSLQYQSGSKTENPTGQLIYEWYPCEVGEVGGYYNNLDFMLTLTFVIKELSTDGGEITPSPPASCTVNININNTGNKNNTEEHMKSDPHGEILAASNSDIFNDNSKGGWVQTAPRNLSFNGWRLRYGIPSSEHTKTMGFSEKYLADYQYANMTGTVTYDIEVQKGYNLVWETSSTCNCTKDGCDICYTPHSAFESVTKRFDDVYSVDYWQIAHFGIYTFSEALFRNYALPNESVRVENPNLATAESIHNPEVKYHVILKNCDGVDLGQTTIDGGSSRPPVPDETDLFKQAAKLTSRPPDLRNDKTVVDRILSMDDILIAGVPGNTSVKTPTPKDVELAPFVKVERSPLQIDIRKVNRWQTPSSISSYYNLLRDSSVMP